MALSVSIEEHGVIVVEGVRITVALLKELLNDPPSDSLFRFQREEDQILVTRFEDPALAAEFLRWPKVASSSPSTA